MARAFQDQRNDSNANCRNLKREFKMPRQAMLNRKKVFLSLTAALEEKKCITEECKPVP